MKNTFENETKIPIGTVEEWVIDPQEDNESMNYTTQIAEGNIVYLH